MSATETVVTPARLGCRDTLHLEMGMARQGNGKRAEACVVKMLFYTNASHP